MKKIPQPGDAQPESFQAVKSDEPRSLADRLREAEQAQQQTAAQALRPDEPSGATGSSGKGRRTTRKVSRNQARRFARERALQALYQWDLSDGQSSTVRTEFLDNQDMSRVDTAYFEQLFNGVAKDPDAVDVAMNTALDRPISDLDPIERAVLRLAVFELQHCADIPARVIISEALEITKRFGADNGHRYVNGVLDKVAVALRSAEMSRRS